MSEHAVPTTIDEMEFRSPYEERLKRKPYEAELRSLQIEMLKVQRWVRDEGGAW